MVRRALKNVVEYIKYEANKIDVTADCRQSNIEGEIINFIQEVILIIMME